jgi:hypothetical protein
MTSMSGEDQQQDQQRQHDVAGPLDQAVDAAERRVAHRDHRDAAHRVAAALDQVGDEHVGHEVDRGGGVLQAVEHLQDARPRGHGQRQVDELDAVLLDVGRQVVDLSDQPVLVLGFAAVLAAVVKKTLELNARIGRAGNVPGQRNALLVHADDHRAARRSLQFQQLRRRGPERQVRAGLGHGRDPQPVHQHGHGKFVEVLRHIAGQQQQAGNPYPVEGDGREHLPHRQAQL